MPTVSVNLSTTAYVQVNNAFNPMVLQALRDSVRITISKNKPVKNNTVFHLLGGKDAPFNFRSIDTNVWALAITDKSSLIVSELAPVKQASLIDSAVLHGEVFYGDYVDLAVANNGSLDVLIKSGLQDVLFKVGFATAGDNTTEVLEGTTVSADGNVQTNFNVKRSDVTTTIDTKVYIAPTITNDGASILGPRYHIAGEKKDAVAVGGSGFLLLKANTNYLYRLTNISGASSIVNVQWEILE